MSEVSFEFYEDARVEWRWRAKSANHRIVGAACEGYKNEADCRSNAARHTAAGRVAGDRWTFHEEDSQWRWRLTAANNRIVGASSEAYHNRQDCEHNARLLGYQG